MAFPWSREASSVSSSTSLLVKSPAEVRSLAEVKSLSEVNSPVDVGSLVKVKSPTAVNSAGPFSRTKNGEGSDIQEVKNGTDEEQAKPQAVTRLLRFGYREELRLRHLSLNHHDNRVFYCCQWELPCGPLFTHVIYVILRLGLAGFCLNALTSLFISKTARDNMYLVIQAFTTWSFILLTLHMLIAYLLTIVFFASGANGLQGGSISGQSAVPMTESQKEKSYDNPEFTGRPFQSLDNYGVENYGNSLTPSTPWYLKVSWLLSNIVSVASVIVTVVYWSFVYPDKPGHRILKEDWEFHILNFVVVVVDHIVSARPVRIMHAVFGMIYGLIYLVFSISLWAHDHENVLYKFLDWGDPEVAIPTSLLLCFIGVPFIQMYFFDLYVFKTILFKLFHGHN